MAILKNTSIDEAKLSYDRWKEAEIKLNAERWQINDKEERERREQEVRQLKSAIIPYVGMKCTMVYFSDCRASEVTEVLSPRRIVVRHNRTKCLDWFGNRYEIYDDLEGGEYIFTKRVNGQWIMETHAIRDGVALSLVSHYHSISPEY